MKTSDSHQPLHGSNARSEQSFFRTKAEQVFFSKGRSHSKPFFNPSSTSPTIPIQTKMKPVTDTIQRLGEKKDELKMKPIELVQREAMEENDELQMKPMVQRAGAEGVEVSAESESEPNDSKETTKYLKEDVYKLNQHNWGVCGFVAAYQAASQKTKMTQPGKRMDKQILLDMVLRYNDHLTKTKRETEIWRSILDFSKSFTDNKTTYDYGTFEAAINYMIDDIELNSEENDDVKVSAEERKERENRKIDERAIGIGLAMTPEAIVELLKSYNVEATIESGKTETLKTAPKHTVLGLTDREGKGLKHWVYKNPSEHLWTWGKDFSTDEEYTVDVLQEYYPTILYIIRLLDTDIAIEEPMSEAKKAEFP